MDTFPKKTIAIIGAGPGGLASAKEALACGLIPKVFEKTHNIGGLWSTETGGMWASMQTNLSKYSCCFSDFPWENSTSDFLSQQQVIQYLSDYTKHFGLNDYIKVNTCVTKIEEASGRWKVTYENSGIAKSEEFDFVIVASGIFSKPYIPTIPGMEAFQGQILHSFHYKKPEDLKGDRILVVGGAFSGAEIANDISASNKKVLNVVTQPLWVVPRYIPASFLEGQPLAPIDLVSYIRAKNKESRSLPYDEAMKARNSYFSHISRQNELCPELGIEITSNPPKIAISNTYLDNIKAGKISIKRSQIESLTENNVLFKDGTQEPVDCIIFCTGFLLELPFFGPEILEKLSYDKNDQFQPLLLHKCTFAPELPNMGFVGIYRGPYFGIMELQARWITLAFSKGEGFYPAQEAMLKGVEEERKIKDLNLRPQFPHADYVNFSDSFASEIGALPDFEGIKETDPDLYRMLWNNPLIPAHYRLGGFGEKREIALKQIEDLDKAMSEYSKRSKEN